MRPITIFSLITMIWLSTNSYSQHNSELNLMPWPQEIEVPGGFYKIQPEFRVSILGSDEEFRVKNSSIRFLRYLSNKTGVFLQNGYPYNSVSAGSKGLILEVERTEVLAIGVDESYTLKIDGEGIKIKSKTDLGALHGLSTLAQLIEVRDGAYVFPFIDISDAPRFVWRGLMMDVGRHFMPVDVVKRNLDAMAFVKLNVFHWHLSDDQGFRVEVKQLPKLHEDASDGLYYTQDQIKDVVKYADDLGIRVVPELDVPGHATAFLTAYPEFASNKEIDYQLERNSGIFDPTLDPTNPDLYVFLDVLFKEVTPLFPDEYFHIGGDENEGKHWDENPDIQAFMKENNLADNHELQTYFNIELEKILQKYDKKLMGWEEIMTPNMPKTALIHSWRGINEGLEPGESLLKAVKNGYQTILSNGYYIDLLLSVEDHYLTDPMPQENLTDLEKSRILGGEATMWSELVTPLTIDTRIWPRTAAIAERFWSDSEVKDLDDMHRRLGGVSQMLEGVGLRHLQVKDYLLRNISNYHDTRALEDLTDISEPLKIYTRNTDGTQYQVYSPFTLFADACNANASDVRPFRKEVEAYILKESENGTTGLSGFLSKWASIYERLEMIENEAPLTERILPYAKRIRDISTLMLSAIEEGQLSVADFEEIEALLNEEEDPDLNLDVELAVKDEIQRLANYLNKKS